MRDAVESLLKIYIVVVQLPLPFTALFDDVVQGKDLDRASISKTWLLLSESLVHRFRGPRDDELG